MMDLVSMLGFSDKSPYRFSDSLTIQGNNITMDSTGIPLSLQPMKKGKKKGKPVIGNPYSKENIVFPNDIDSVVETPIAQSGGPVKIEVNPDTLYLPENSMLKYYRNRSSNRFQSGVGPEFIPSQDNAKNFSINWLKSPASLQRLQKLVKDSNKAKENINNAIANTNNTIVFSEPDRLKEVSDPRISKWSKDKKSDIDKASDIALNLRKAIIDNNIGYLNAVLGKSSQITKGFYSPNGQIINVTGEYAKRARGTQDKEIGETIVHEISHASGMGDFMKNYTPTPSYENLKPLFNSPAFKMFNKSTQKNLQRSAIELRNNKQQDKSYMNDDGFYPRIMEMRYRSDVKPDEIITPERYRKIKSENEDNDIYRYFDDDKVRWMLNNFVKKDNTEKIPLAQQGLWLKDRTGWVDSVHSANKNLNFVDRYLNSNKYPLITNPDGTVSTHEMEQSDNIVYPRDVLMKGSDTLQHLSSNQAYDYALKNKEYIKFKTEDQALWYAANGYKQGTKNPYKQQGGMTSNQMLQFLFDDEDEVKPPTAEEVVEEPNKDDNEIIREEILRNAKKQQDYDLAMEIAMTGSKVNPYDEDVFYSGEGNPYSIPSDIPITNTRIGNPYSAPSTNLNADTYLKAIFGNEAGKTGIDPQNVKGTASGKYGIIKSGRKDIYNAFYKNDMTYTTFEKMYNSSPNFEYEVAKKLAQININNSKTAAEAIGRWYSPAHASAGQWNTIPRPDYGNKLTMSQYVNRALKNIK